MDHLRSVLEEANNIANSSLDDLEPLAVPSEGIDAADISTSSLKESTSKFIPHKVGKTNSSNLKKSWKKPTDKPKRPLSAYNIFFLHEREKIITSNPDAQLDDVLYKIKNTVKPKKRRHRKSHGKIGFADLARTIADKWKQLDPVDKDIYQEKTAIAKTVYREQLEEWTKVREEKAREDEKKSPMELARVEVVMDSQTHNELEDKYSDAAAAAAAAAAIAAAHHHHTLMNEKHAAMMRQSVNFPDLLQSHPLIMGNTNNAVVNPFATRHHHHQQSSTAGSTNVQDYLSMTQHTIDMARASLSLPLFANLTTPPAPSLDHGMTGAFGGATDHPFSNY